MSANLPVNIFGDDRRNAERTPSKLRAQIELFDKATVFDCLVVDISEIGALIKIENTFLLPREFRVIIPLKSWKRNALVKWRDETYIGVEFSTEEVSKLMDRVTNLEKELRALQQRLMKDSLSE